MKMYFLFFSTLFRRPPSASGLIPAMLSLGGESTVGHDRQSKTTLAPRSCRATSLLADDLLRSSLTVRPETTAEIRTNFEGRSLNPSPNLKFLYSRVSKTDTTEIARRYPKILKQILRVTNKLCPIEVYTDKVNNKS